ncbi:type II secretion system protein [Ruminococcus sp.]
MKTPMNVFNTAMKKKKKNRKGFSLVELIVVLVIMAILAAALVPSLIGYIRQSRQSNSKNEAAQCVQAAQTITSSAFASTDRIYVNQSGTNITFTDFNTFPTEGKDVVKSLAEVTGTVESVTIVDGVVKGLSYKAKNGDEVTYNSNGTYTVGGTGKKATTAATTT